MAKDFRVYLEDILESIKKIEEYTHEDNFEKFTKNTERQDVVMRRLEIIGEAVKSLSGDFKEKYPSIPWRQIASMRDMLIHEYAGVSLGPVWKVVADDLKPLKEIVVQMLDELPKE